MVLILCLGHIHMALCKFGYHMYASIADSGMSLKTNLQNSSVLVIETQNNTGGFLKTKGPTKKTAIDAATKDPKTFKQNES